MMYHGLKYSLEPTFTCPILFKLEMNIHNKSPSIGPITYFNLHFLTTTKVFLLCESKGTYSTKLSHEHSLCFYKLPINR